MKSVGVTLLVGVSIIGTRATEAATHSASMGVTLTAVATCSLTANTLNAGFFPAGSTAQSFKDRYGSATPNSGGIGISYLSTAGPLATVMCDSGTAWQLSISGSHAADNRVLDVQGPGSGCPIVFSVTPIAHEVVGTNIGLAGLWPLEPGINTLSVTRTGAHQIVLGSYLSYGSNASQQTAQLSPDIYVGTGIATLTY